MKKFKRIFYPVYLIFSIGMVYFTIDGLMNTEDAKVWFGEKFSAENQPFWILLFFLMLSVLMLVEIVIENIQLHRLKNEIPDLEEEILRLKAKLFDKSDLQDDSDEDEDDED